MLRWSSIYRTIYGGTHSEIQEGVSFAADELRTMDAFWCAANYLSLGVLYLYKNSLLREPLMMDHIKKRLIEAGKLLAEFALVGVDHDRLAVNLQCEEVESFAHARRELLDAIGSKRTENRYRIRSVTDGLWRWLEPCDGEFQCEESGGLRKGTG